MPWKEPCVQLAENQQVGESHFCMTERNLKKNKFVQKELYCEEKLSLQIKVLKDDEPATEVLYPPHFPFCQNEQDYHQSANCVG